MNELEIIRRKQLREEAIKNSQREIVRRPEILVYRGNSYAKLLTANLTA